MASDSHRLFCKRQHRILGHYCAVQAWLQKKDCIVLVRNDLESFLSLERFKSVRINWLQDDLKPWFKYQSAYYKTGSPSSIHSLFLSRVPILNHLPSGSMTTEKRIETMGADAPSTGRLTKGYEKGLFPSEKEIISFLALLSGGLTNPHVEIEVIKKNAS